MLEVLQKHLQPASKGCVVSSWINTLNDEEREMLNLIKESKNAVMADLYKDLQESTDIPFKLTAFRSHMKGYCTCPKN